MKRLVWVGALLVVPGFADVDRHPAGVPLTPLPATWSVVTIGPCERAPDSPCAISLFSMRGYTVPGGGRPPARPVRIAFADNPSGVLKQVIGPPFDGSWTVTFGEKPVGRLAIAEDLLVFVPRSGLYDVSVVRRGPRLGWQWGASNPRAPRMPRQVALAVGGDPDSTFVAHLDPGRRSLSYLVHPDGWQAVSVPLEDDAAVVALCVDGSGSLHAICTGSGSVFYATNAGGKPRRDIIAPAGSGNRGAIVADDHGDIHVVYCDSRTQGIEYWKTTDGGWKRALIAESDGVDVHLCVTADAGRLPHIAYGSPRGLVYMTQREVTWIRHRVSEEGPIAGCAVVVDADVVVHLCFTDGDRGVVKYATSGEPKEKR